MNVIAKNTEQAIDTLSLSDLSEVANNAAECVESDMRSAVQNAITAGRALISAKSQCAHGQWLDWLKSNWRFGVRLAQDYMSIANTQNSAYLTSASSISEALRMIADAKQEAKADAEASQPELGLVDSEVDSIVVDDAFVCAVCSESFDTPVWHCEECDHHWTEDVDLCRNCHSATADGLVDESDEDHVEYEDAEDDGDSEEPVDAVRQYYTVEQWDQLEEVERLHLFHESSKTLNKQDTTSIEWAQWSWNPITGCKHDCPYCYARDIANRFYEQKFEPSIYPERFNAPKNTSVPEKAEKDTSYRNIFTGSMADIFGRWVPAEWVNRVMGVVEECPEWNFLFLTKFPQRVHEFGHVPSNAWMGTTVDCQARVDNAEKAFSKMGGGIKWLSVEPMLTPLKFSRLDLFDWVVIGGASRSSTTPAWVPPFDWIVDLHNQAREAGCAVYHKDNLKFGEDVRLKEFPWEKQTSKSLPEAMKYLNIT